MPNPKALVSAGILLTLALHPIPIFYAKERKTLWPVLEWSMYKNSRPPGPIAASKRSLFGITAKGERHRITSRHAGSSGFAFESVYLRPMWKGDSSAARLLFDKINYKREDPFVELHLTSQRYTVTDTGVVREDDPDIVYRSDRLPVRGSR